MSIGFIGTYYETFITKQDEVRVETMKWKSSKAGKKRRKSLRSKRKGYSDNEKET